MTGDKEKSRKNDQLRHEDLMRGVNALRSDIAKAQQDQLKNLETFSQNISREITVAMTATTTHTETVNQGSLQAIFDLMANRSNVPTGNATAVPSSSTDPLSGDVPGQGSTLFEEDPCIPYADKGKKCETGSRTPRSEPLMPGLSFVPMHQTPQMGQDNGRTAPSTPLGTKGDRPPWHTPNSGHTPSLSPRWGRPPLNPPGRQPPNGGPGGDPDDGDGGGGGGRGRGGGGGDTPDPGRPPEDPSDGGLEDLRKTLQTNPQTGIHDEGEPQDRGQRQYHPQCEQTHLSCRVNHQDITGENSTHYTEHPPDLMK